MCRLASLQRDPRKATLAPRSGGRSPGGDRLVARASGHPPYRVVDRQTHGVRIGGAVVSGEPSRALIGRWGEATKFQICAAGRVVPGGVPNAGRSRRDP
ncbi:hypothetical protein GQ55_7G151900 [Panicum hallii var. hallii]|uniref:Uncharacterized protein n=1 Tax=Panicum hallii var. hallii TaxID=1504633 RepID=A0A2T7CVB7_9POAL|nr:hypothetical protein GQ55_7G151900 [Panicum hallii var. hallii]